MLKIFTVINNNDILLYAWIKVINLIYSKDIKRYLVNNNNAVLGLFCQHGIVLVLYTVTYYCDFKLLIY